MNEHVTCASTNRSIGMGWESERLGEDRGWVWSHIFRRTRWTASDVRVLEMTTMTWSWEESSISRPQIHGTAMRFCGLWYLATDWQQLAEWEEIGKQAPDECQPQGHGQSWVSHSSFVTQANTSERSLHCSFTRYWRAAHPLAKSN